MTKKMKLTGVVLMAMFIFTMVSPVFSTTVKADSASSEVEEMLNALVVEYGEESVVFENGIILDINEEIILSEVSENENIIWSIKDETIASINESGTLTGLQEGTTFLVEQVGEIYHLREIYVSNPEEQMVQAAFAEGRAAGSYLVYLDPGHGGSDPGARGNGIVEKDLVLKISKDVKSRLENAGVRVVMSRESDVYVSLKERSQGANAINPDIFVSVHINSASASSAYGIESFYMKDMDYNLAHNIQNRLMQNIQTINRGVKWENFHVMRETKMPSTLLELGFLSNPAEAGRLKDSGSQSVMAEAITNGSLDYLRNNVTLGSLDGERIYGTDRYETSYQLFERGWDTSESVVLAYGLDYPDALAAAPLAGKNNAPILLTKNSSLEYQPRLKNLLVDKAVKNVFIVGGTGVITSEIDNELAAMGISVKRLGGIDRYETAVLIANEVGINNGEVSIVNGLSFADGLSMSSIAAKKNSPILLTRTNDIPESTRGFLNANSGSIGKTYVIGSTGVVSDNVAGQLNGPERLGGKDRYATNKSILDRFKGELDLSSIYIASGLTFADALSSSALAGKDNNFVLLSNTAAIEGTVAAEIAENKDSISRAYILGSNGVISDGVIRGLGINLN